MSRRANLSRGCHRRYSATRKGSTPISISPPPHSLALAQRGTGLYILFTNMTVSTASAIFSMDSGYIPLIHTCMRALLHLNSASSSNSRKHAAL